MWRSAGRRVMARAADGHAADPAAKDRKRRRSIDFEARPSSKPFQQAVDVIELDFRAETLTGAAAQLVQDLAGLLQGILVRDLYVSLIVSAVVRHRAAERIAFDAIARIAVGGADVVIVGISAAEAALHLLGELARRLLQLVERFGLGPDRLAWLLALQRLGRIAHGPLGPPEGLGYVAEPVAEPTHHLAEHAPQRSEEHTSELQS